MPQEPEVGSSRELSPQELKLLQALADGRRMREFASELKTSEQTLKNRLRFARLKLGADTTSQAVAMGVRRGLID